MTFRFRVLAGFAGVAASTMALAGCMSGPTYGTGKTPGEHLMDGIGGIVDITPQTKNDQIAYRPHPQLVVPKSEQLAPPQQSLADSATNPNWVESPEQTRARLRAEADANSAAGSNYRSPLLGQSASTDSKTLEEQTKAFREARKIDQGIYGDKRRFLSDPPLDYRKVDTAELNDLGTPEKVKERERKKEATAAQQTNRKWWDIFD